MCQGEMLALDVREFIAEKAMHVGDGEWRCFISEMRDFLDMHEEQLDEKERLKG